MSVLLKNINSGYGKYFLIGVDLAFILISISRFGSDISGGDDVFSVSKDGGYAEYFQYAKFGIAILLLSAIALMRKSALAVGWAIVFFMLLLDDKVSIHERFGLRLVEIFSLEPILSLRARDSGELLVYAAWAVIAAVVLAVATWLDKSQSARQLSKALFLSLLGLAFFGGVVDMLGIAATQIWSLSEFAKRCFDAVEDGGEMIVISLALWCICQSYLHSRVSETSRI